jgi:hypothetical protein
VNNGVRQATKFPNLFYGLHQADFDFLSEAFLVFVTILWERAIIRFAFFSFDDVARRAAAKNSGNFRAKAVLRIIMSLSGETASLCREDRK